MFKKEKTILYILLFLLVLPRILAYPVFGPGIVGTDAEMRYFPQVAELNQSFSHLFSQTGPLYSLFLLFFQKISGDMITGPVFIQHILGVISGLLVFYYLRKINNKLAFIVTIFSFSNPLAIWLEHTILREAFVSLFLIILIILLTENKYFKFSLAFLSGLIGLGLVLLRIEFLILIVLIPLILFIIKRRNNSNLGFKNKLFLKWSFVYYLPFIIIFIVFTVFLQKPELTTSYGSYFNIAYLGLQPEVFYYGDSQYPELLEKYQEVLESNKGKKMSKSLALFQRETENYLSGHPEIKLSMLGLMDKIYIEILIKNNLAYQRSFVVNLKEHFLGVAEFRTLISKDEFPILFRISGFLMLILSWIIFLLFLPALPFIFLRWKKLPQKIIIFFLIGVVHIFVLAFLSDPAHRFRYSLDPFIYFTQIYLILIFINWLASKTKFYFFKKS